MTKNVTFWPAGETATNVQPGDFILVHGTHIVNKFIEWGERIRFSRGAEWSHAAFCETPDGVIEALTRGVVRSPLEKYKDLNYVLVHTGLDGQDTAQAVAFAQSCVGQHYGFGTDVAIALRFLTPGRGLWFGLNGTEICSGLVAQALVRGWANFPVNPASMSPAELAETYSVPLEQLPSAR